jgi:iron complex outermembrane recepter protein
MAAVRASVAGSLIIIATAASSARAQEVADVVLPEVVVTSPSPVAKPKPAVAKPKPKPKAPAPQPQAQKQKPSQSNPTPAQASPPPPEPVEAATPAAVMPEEAALTEVEAPEAQQILPGTLLVSEDAFVPVTVTVAREFEANRGATITDTLQHKPGISGSTFTAGSNRPVVRGLDNFRVRVQENGVGTLDVSSLSEDHAVPVDPFAAGRVEVVRGPATLRYGSQAIGGVVAVENQRIPTFVPEGGVSAEVKGGLSAVDDGRDGAFQATLGSGGVALHADGFVRRADDYDTPNGRQFNTFVDSEGFSVGTSLIGPSGFIGVAFTRVESLYGIPGEEAAEARPRIDLEQNKWMVKGEWRIKDFGIDAVRVWFGASDYAHNEVRFEEGEGDIVGTRFTNEEYEARAELQHSPFKTAVGELNGALGVQWGSKNIAGVAVDEPIDGLLDPADVRTVAGFWFEELELSNALRLQAAARIEHAEARGNGFTDVSNPDAPVAFAGERAFTPFSGSLGALYELPLGVVARVTGQYVERAPDAAELFSKGVHEATGTFEIGNPNLDVEDARTIEFGLKKAGGPLRFDASVYATRYAGFIFKEFTGAGCAETLDTCNDVFGPDEETLDQVIYQQRDATFYGAEIAVQYDVAPIWRGVWGIDGQYDFVRAEFDGGENVPRIPPHRLGGGLFYRDANWFARTGVLHAFDQDQIGFGEIETPGYTLVSAELSYTTALNPIDGIGTSMTIGLKGENLADEEVLNHTSFKRREDVLLPGASVRLFGSIKLN